MNIQPLAVTTDLMTAFYEGAFRSDDNQIFATPARESGNRCYRKITPFWRAARRAFLLILIKIGRKRSIMGMREHPMELMGQDPTE